MNTQVLIDDSRTSLSTMRQPPVWGQGGGGVAASAPMLLDLDRWGVAKALWLPGASGNCVSVPDAASLDIAGDIDIRVRVALKDYTPPSGTLIGKWEDSTNRAYALNLTPGGSMQLYWSPDGSTSMNVTSTVGVGAADQSLVWLRVTMDVDDGAGNRVVRFYTSTSQTNDPAAVVWTQLGSTITQAGATSIFNSTAPLIVGGYHNARGSVASRGGWLCAQIRNGIDGTPAITLDFTQWGTGDTHTTPEGHVATINRSSSGATTEIVDRNCLAVATSGEKLVLSDRDALDSTGPGDEFTVVGSLYARTPGPAARYWEKGAHASSTPYYLLYLSSGRPTWSVGDGSAAGTADHAGGATDVTDATWRTVAWRRADDLLETLVGGTVEGSKADTWGTFANGTNVTLFSNANGGETLFGLHRWVALFRRALTSTEHAELAAWDGSVATEPSWLRSAATFYWNADDILAAHYYDAENFSVVNLAA